MRYIVIWSNDIFDKCKIIEIMKSTIFAEKELILLSTENFLSLFF